MALDEDVPGPASMPDFFARAPDSWLYMLIRRLTPRDRLSAFRSCWQLASHVVKSAPTINLHLGGHADAESSDITRQCTITRLLQAGKKLSVNVAVQDGQLAFPVGLSGHIQKLQVQVFAENATLGSHFQWADLHSLQKLTWTGHVHALDVTTLCDALEAGELQQLQQLEFQPADPASLDAAAMARLVQALGGRLTHFSTNVASMLPHLPHLTHLEYVEVRHCEIDSQSASQLCEHMRLRTVRLEKSSVVGDHRHRQAAWETLILQGVQPRVLAALPLTRLHEILLIKDVPACDDQDLEALRNTLSCHADKLVCEPNGEDPLGMFHMCCDLHEATVQLVHRLRGDPVLRISGAAHSPTILPAIWQALPACVRTVGLCAVTGVDWRLLWKRLPESVTHVILLACDVPVGFLGALIYTAPAHISRLALAHGDDAVRAGWVAAGLRELAPSHLSLIMTGWL